MPLHAPWHYLVRLSGYQKGENTMQQNEMIAALEGYKAELDNMLLRFKKNS